MKEKDKIFKVNNASYNINKCIMIPGNEKTRNVNAL